MGACVGGFHAYNLGNAPAEPKTGGDVALVKAAAVGSSSTRSLQCDHDLISKDRRNCYSTLSKNCFRTPQHGNRTRPIFKHLLALAVRALV